MSTSPASMPVYALVNLVETSVVSASHPTEARNPSYKPPFNHVFLANSVAKEEDRVMQHIGTAYLQEDGGFRIDLTDLPPSRTLYIMPLQPECKQ